MLHQQINNFPTLLFTGVIEVMSPKRKARIATLVTKATAIYDEDDNAKGKALDLQLFIAHFNHSSMTKW